MFQVSLDKLLALKFPLDEIETYFPISLSCVYILKYCQLFKKRYDKSTSEKNLPWTY